METIKLKHFCAVVETGSLTKAATLMGITHPGIHKSLKSLEFELGIELTFPDGRGIGITSDGISLYEKAKEIVTRVDQLHESIRQQNNNVIRLGLCELFNFTLPSCIVKTNNNTNENYSFHERCPGEIEPQVASNKLDFGVTTHPLAHTGIVHTKIGNVDFSLFGLRELRDKNVESLHFIIPNSFYEDKERDHWSNDLLVRKNIIKTNMLSIGLELARDGHGVIFTSDFLINNTNKNQTPKRKLFQIQQNLKKSIPVYLVSTPGKKMEHIKQFLISTLKNHINN